MPYYKFGPNDIFYNRIKTHPKCEFLIYNANIYYNRRFISGSSHPLSAQISSPVTQYLKHVPQVGDNVGLSGSVSLFELNVDRDSRLHTYDSVLNLYGNKSLIYPFIVKGGNLLSFKTVATGSSYFEDFQYGDLITGSYPLSGNITRHFLLKIRQVQSEYKSLLPSELHWIFIEN